MKMPTLAKQHLFWDVDLATLTPETHARYIIERVLRYGDEEDVRWMQETYTPERICDTLTSSRSLDDRSREFWSFIYTVSCTKKPSEKTPSAFSQR